MRKISLLGAVAGILVHVSAFAEMVEIVCYYQVTGGGKLLSGQDLIDLRYKYYTPVVTWSAGKKIPTLFGYGPDKFSEFTYTVQHIGVGPLVDAKIDSTEIMKNLRADFEYYGVSDPKVSFSGCKTTPLKQ